MLFNIFQKKKIGMIFGSFDILHKGHLNYIKKAKEHCDYLICVISLDSTIKKLKKSTPINNEKKRKNNIKNLKICDKVVIGNKKDKLKIIEKYKPKKLIFGYDQKSFNLNIENELKKRNLNCEIITFKKGFCKNNFKSSKLKTILGVVKEGDKRGRLIGFRTANLYPKKDLGLINGVYKVKVILKNKKYNGILNCGVRPTFKNNKKLVYETHILNFDKNIYEKEIKIEIQNFLRFEKKFENMEKLKKQIKKDISLL